ncbi:MAG: oligosaccharide flippase family protein [Eubacteriales bacterium]|nr:oligosaccharide flippase family protein [Eubacteriales bacterium]
MKSDQRKAGVLLSYLSIGINSVIQLAYTPVMLQLLGQSEYGLYALVVPIVGYLGLLTFGIGGAYLRFYSREWAAGNKDGVARLNGMFLLVFAAISVVVLLVGGWLAGNASMVFGDKLSARESGRAAQLIGLIVVNMAISIPGGVFSSYITAHEQYFFQRIVGLASSILNPFLTLPLMLMGFGSLALVLVSLALNVATLALNVHFCFHRLHMRFLFRGFSWGLLKEIYIFSFFLFLNQVIDQVNWSVDSFLLGRFWGTAEVAVYGLASRLNSIYLTFSTSVSSVFAPQINRIVAEGRETDQKLSGLMLRVGRIQGLILLLLLSGMTLLGKPFLLWLGGSEAYLRSYPVMLLLIVPVTIPLIQNLGIEIQRAKNRHQFRSIVYLLMAGINVLLSIPLSSRFGAVGAAVGTTLSLLVGNGLVMNWYYHRRLGLDMTFFWKGMARLGRGGILPALYCVACGVWLDVFRPAAFLLSGIGLVAVYCVSMWRWGMDAYEKSIILRPLDKLRRLGGKR